MAKIVKTTSLFVMAVAIQFCPFAAQAASSCALDQQWDREALTAALTNCEIRLSRIEQI